jgi:SAM-dependent methyltransferase
LPTGNLLKRLAEQRISSGTIVDLATGTGILSRAVSESGFDAWGVDISGDMLRIARKTAENAKLTLGSLWEAKLPPCVAVAAIGEAFSYNADGKRSSSALRARIETIHDALAPGGVLLFDVACPGRSGADGLRRVFWTKDTLHLGLEEREDRDARRLLREITVFISEGNRYRRSYETHRLYLYTPDEVEATLTASGFVWERLRRYADLELSAGWQAYAACKKTR